MSDKPPSRERYEQQNPTVSFRISREKKETLDDLVEGMETTKKEWFETVIEDTKQQYDAVFEQGFTKGRREGFADGREEGCAEGYDEGYDDGYGQARDKYHVLVPCAGCGRQMVLTEPGKEELWQLLSQLSAQGPFTAKPPSSVGIDWTMGHEACVGPENALDG